MKTQIEYITDCRSIVVGVASLKHQQRYYLKLKKTICYTPHKYYPVF